MIVVCLLNIRVDAIHFSDLGIEYTKITITYRHYLVMHIHESTYNTYWQRNGLIMLSNYPWKA